MTTRDVVADGFGAKARESFASAQADLAAGRYNSCVNRCYFACFQAAVAALIQAGSLSARAEPSHKLVQTSFSDLVSRRKLFPASLNGTLQRVRDLRTLGDYRPASASRRNAEEGVRLARQFVLEVAT